VLCMGRSGCDPLLRFSVFELDSSDDLGHPDLVQRLLGLAHRRFPSESRALAGSRCAPYDGDHPPSARLGTRPGSSRPRLRSLLEAAGESHGEGHRSGRFGDSLICNRNYATLAQGVSSSLRVVNRTLGNRTIRDTPPNSSSYTTFEHTSGRHSEEAVRSIPTAFHSVFRDSGIRALHGVLDWSTEALSDLG
jgi:hypothetical protein